jgi:RNA polymerase sigma factor (sigma-70 family)
MAQIDQALIDQLYHRANAGRWQVSVERFARALEASAAKALGSDPGSERGSDLKRYLGSLRLEDLALACACAEGNAAAWDHFVLEYRAILYRSADAMDSSGGARELADSLYADLFGLQAEGDERQSLFRYFHGRSSLATWLRAVLAQRQVDRARAAAKTVPLPDEEPAANTHPPDPDRTRYLMLIHAAFREAVARLAAKDRLRLLYYYAQGLTLAQAGRLLREHEASVSRHLSAARKAIRRDVERHLRDAGLDAGEIARCFECVAADPGPLDLDRLLGAVSSGAAAIRDGGPPSGAGPVGSHSDPTSKKLTARNPEPDVRSVERSNSAAWRGEKGA